MNDSSLTLLLPEEPLTESLLSGLIVILYHIPINFHLPCKMYYLENIIFYNSLRKSYVSKLVKIQ